MSSKYNLQLVRLLLTSIDDVEMRRLKEGFYSIMKLANAVRDRGDAAKEEMRGFVRDNKIEKPVTEAIIQISSAAGGGGGCGGVSFDVAVNKVEEGVKVVKGKKAKKSGGPAVSFKKKLQLKLGAGEGNGDKEERKEIQQEIKEAKVEDKVQVEMPVVIEQKEDIQNIEEKVIHLEKQNPPPLPTDLAIV
jgi:hypothetical protein